MIGQALPMITSYGELDNSQQVVALINEVCTVLKRVLHAVKQRIVRLKFDACRQLEGLRMLLNKGLFV